MKKNVLPFLLLLICFTSLAQVPIQIKDINSGNASAIPFYDNQIIEYKGQLYFSADDGTNGVELWTSDGTEAGTMLVKDILSGAESSECQNFYLVNDYLLFTATTDLGQELWRSDGTTTGTVLVKDIRVGSSDGVFTGNSPRNKLFVWNEVLYFTGNDGTSANWELWRSDGTEEGTFMVKNISSSGGSFPNEYGEHDGKLYFAANDGSGGELWVTDGTEGGTELVADIAPSFGSRPDNLISCNGYLLFTAAASSANEELWRSDGTEAGTVLVKDINPMGGGLQTQPNTFEHRLIKIGNTVFFSADDGVNGRELWKSDGTEEGTVLVLDATPGAEGYAPQNFAVAEEILYYKYDDDVHGHELWRSDGTEAGTYLMKDIKEGTSGSFSLPTQIAAIDNHLFLRAANGSSFNQELWQSDGTEEGTVLVAEINPGNAESSPWQFIEYQDYVVFAARTSDSGYELWKYLLPQPEPLAGQILITQAIACSGATGALAVNVSGGEPPFSYIWNDPTLQGASPSGLSAGDYAVTVTDNDGMTLTLSITLDEPPLLEVFLSSTPATGSMADGTASVSASGGTPPYTFDWDIAGSSNTPTVSDLMAGVYYVTVTDANSCTVTGVVEVDMTNSTTPLIELNFQLIPNPAKSYFTIQSLGMASEIQLFDSFGRLVKQWSKVASGQELTIGQQAPGVYMVSVKFGNQCLVEKLIVRE